MDTPAIPTLETIRAAREQLGDLVRRTPTWCWSDTVVTGALGPDAAVHLKLELFQHAGSFKVRGALLNLMALDDDQRARGVTAVSAGNHAWAVAHAARILGTTAKVVMPENADPFRVEGCRRTGAEVVLVADVHAAFTEVRRIEDEEGRTFVHPFDGPNVALGTATVALELLDDVPDLDAVVVPIGGGGLCAGIATAVAHLRPECAVYGVEPEGADTMHRSFAAGEPQGIEEVRTIADSLGAPFAMPYSFGLCRRFVTDLVRIDDDAMRAAMGTLFRSAKLAVEPAGAASTAALLGPLRERLHGRRVGLILCGSNLAVETFCRLAR